MFDVNVLIVCIAVLFFCLIAASTVIVCIDKCCETKKAVSATDLLTAKILTGVED